MTRAQKIFEIATEFIRSASFAQDYWRATSIGEMRTAPQIPFVLGEDEYPIVSASLPEDNWYVWTTQKLVTCCEGVRYEVNSEDIVRADLGEMTWQLQLPIKSFPIFKRAATFYNKLGVAARLYYETGFASLALVYCNKYWRIKHPILNKLMTPMAIARYREDKRQMVAM